MKSITSLAVLLLVGNSQAIHHHRHHYPSHHAYFADGMKGDEMLD